MLLAIRELAALTRPLLRMPGRRLAAYPTSFQSSHPRRHHFRQPRASTLSSRFAVRSFHAATVRSKDHDSVPEEPPKMGPKEGGNDPNEVFTDMNVLSGVPPPASAIEIVYEDGFLLNNGMRFHGKDGIVIVHNEAFNWLSDGSAKVQNGVLELDEDLWGILDVVAPKPELLILGTGGRNLQISAKTKNHLHNLGIRIDSMDTNHAASSYNLLATERPGQIVAAALLPVSFR
ncbi:hypothetical protein TWF694_009426 [Orbilia ellipsospora]|uniref:NADH dehydrogenase [ubiquinone] 1 alpha subcomplex assembly factor 3 n=1 Tax=Orbilia ellipsospora TaxID=2528407 RepID=A0AAV9XDT9_9PEZI